MALLREVKYLKQREPNPDQLIPDSAEKMFYQNDLYRKYLQSLDVIVTLYNKVKGSLLSVEESLVNKQLKFIDEQLDKAFTKLNWTSEGTYNVCVCVLILYFSMTRCIRVHSGYM